MDPVSVSFRELAERLGLVQPHEPLRARKHQRLAEVLSLLPLLHVTGTHMAKEDGISMPESLDGPYVLVSGLPTTPWSKWSDHTTITIAPGPWYAGFARRRELYFAPVDRRLFCLSTSYWHVIALGLHLAESWRRHARRGLDAPEFVIRHLFEEAGCPLGSTNIHRTVQRYVAYFSHLVTYDMLTPIDFPRLPAVCGQNGLDAWLERTVTAVPSDRFVDTVHARVFAAHPILDTPGSSDASPTTAEGMRPSNAATSPMDAPPDETAPNSIDPAA
jgi:hypothetical protein